MHSHHGHEHHGPDHDHDHHHAHGPCHTELSAQHFKVLRLVFGMTAAYLFVEIVGGLLSGSLALLADGFHMFADSTAIGISLFAQWFSHRPAPAKNTFGYQRVEIMAAFFNALLLIVMAGFILFESYERFQQPVPIRANLMMAIAAGGLVINLIAAQKLHQGHEHNMNIKGAYLHVLGDLLGSVGAIAAGALIWGFGWYWADPAISFLIAVLITVGALRLLWDAVNVLLEGCPRHLSIEAIRESLLACEGVENVHHLHVWHINLQRTVLTAHLEVLPEAFSGRTLEQVQHMLKEDFGLSHVTLQLELP